VTQREIAIGMKLIDDRLDRLVQEVVFEAFAEVFHDLTVLIRQFQMVWQVQREFTILGRRQIGVVWAVDWRFGFGSCGVEISSDMTRPPLGQELGRISFWTRRRVSNP